MTTPTSSSRNNTPEVLRKQQIRLGLSSDVPLVSQQWNAIIAVNYAARKFGITRLHHNVFDAKQLCPELVCAHVATLGPGDSQPDYYPSPSRYTHKVSLDPYRKASARIFSVFSKYCSKFQKGGLDEIFVDVTDDVNQRIMDEYGSDLSKWDCHTAEPLNWARDYSHAGVVFGMPREGVPAPQMGHDDDDDDDDDEESGRRGPGIDDDEHLAEQGLKDIPITDELEEEDDDETVPSDSTETEALNNTSIMHQESKQKLAPAVAAVASEDEEFDPDLEQYLDSEFEASFSQPQDFTANTTVIRQRRSSASSSRPVKVPPTEEEIPVEKTEEELRIEKEAEAERLRIELEQLRPYFGIPEDTFEEQFWGEMQMLKAAEICNEVRQAVKDELGYTCSAGISSNKLLAKLGSGMNKPFQQRYGDQAGLELWQWTRGIDHVGIRKIKSKSMTSHKSFIPALSDLEEIQFWITSTCLELVSRIEAEFEETERWPRTISLGFYGGRKAWQDQQDAGTAEKKSSFRAPYKGTRSMPFASRFEYGGVEGMSRKMYGTVEKLIKEAETGGGRPILPLVLLTVTVSNFAGGKGSAMGDITKFFSKAPPPAPSIQSPPPLAQKPGFRQTEQTTSRTDTTAVAQQQSPSAIGHSMAIKEEFSPSRLNKDSMSKSSVETVSSAALDDNIPRRRRRFFEPSSYSSQPNPIVKAVHQLQLDSGDQDSEASTPNSPTGVSPQAASPAPSPDAEITVHQPTTITTTQATAAVHHHPTAMLWCDQCSGGPKQIPIDEWEQHQDFHFAMKLQQEDRQQQQLERQQQLQQTNTATSSVSHSSGSKRAASSSVSSSSSSNRGKRKQAPTSTTATSTTPSLSKFFKPSS
ncbi:DNA-directed DNA polymerase eta rad30 [Gryganskiella cystojenkinii]|nr:DNA-directed DNA polymerase eta rad30 [Gryganskiella cystojenkinii]